MNYKYLLSSFVVVACCLLQQCCWGQSTTVRPYKFGFNIDQQQHRREMRDERGIVMGEFGFITADGIYHVTVYATDEQGRFRILAMKNYPYESPPKTVEVMVQPKIPPKTTTTTTTTPKPLTRHNFNTQACSGCFLTNGNSETKDSNAIEGKTPETNTNPLSNPLPNSSAASGLDSKNSPAGQNIHTTLLTQAQTKFVTPPNTLHTNHVTSFTNKVETKENNKIETTSSTSRHSEGSTTLYGHSIDKSSSTTPQVFGSFADAASKQGVTASLTNLHHQREQLPKTNFLQNNTTGSIWNKAYPVQKDSKEDEVKEYKVIFPQENHVKPAVDVQKSNFESIQNMQNSVNTHFYEGQHEQHKNSEGSTPLNINTEETLLPGNQSQIVFVQHKNAERTPLNTNNEETFLLGDQSQNVFYNLPTAKTTTTSNKYDLSSAAAVNTELPLTKAIHRNFKNTALSQKNSLVTKLPKAITVNTAATNSATLSKHLHTHIIHTTPTSTILHKHNTAQPVFVYSNLGFKQKSPQPNLQGGLPSSATTKTTPSNPPPIMDIIMQKVLPALMGKTGQSGAASPTQTAGSDIINNINQSNAVAAGQKPTTSSSAVTKKSAGGSGSPALNGDGDLYRFKYILDYHGHTETGKRNGNKEGSYFAIGDDNVERTIEYVANEFGYQPRVRWRKLDSNEIKSSANTLKDYEFIWFTQ